MILGKHDFAAQRAIDKDEISGAEQNAKGPPRKANFQPVGGGFAAGNGK